MSQEKRAFLVTFQPPTLEATQALREKFATSYDRFLNMDAVEYKCWWVDQSTGTWGAFYVFRSEKELNEYTSTDVWKKVIPEKYGCVPEGRALEVGSIVSKVLITEHEGSWVAE
ncbi:MAG: hypothetical protein KQJ78_21150 [Deltaproteobacteria bacterium]|nr:hypothetical protein [Deltaproteobacteria bacterium]